MSLTARLAVASVVAGLGLPAGASAATGIEGTYGCSPVVGAGGMFAATDSQLVLRSGGRYVFTLNAVNGAPAPSKGTYSRAGSKVTFRGGKLAHRTATIKRQAGFQPALSFALLLGKRHICNRTR